MAKETDDERWDRLYPGAKAICIKNGVLPWGYDDEEVLTVWSLPEFGVLTGVIKALTNFETELREVLYDGNA